MNKALECILLNFVKVQIQSGVWMNPPAKQFKGGADVNKFV